MDAVFTNIRFAEPARAESNLAALAESLPPAALAALPSLLAQVPAPDAALNYLERFAREASPHVREYLALHPAALHYILLLFSYSRFLSETLIHEPSLVTWLDRPGPRAGLDRLKTPDDLNEEFARFEATSFELTPALVLARFKRREYLRITLRDVLRLTTLAETCLELSTLADVLVSRALRISEQKLENAYGTPQFSDAAGRRQAARLSILSLGKLGGQELNYSSDIDLIFFYSHDGETSSGTAGPVSNSEFFVRLAQAILGLITEITPEGAVFRVDMRLRPEGTEGDLAVSVSTALNYYCTRARQWELQMLIKARCSAGDAEAARQFLRELQPRIYPPEPDASALEAVLTARQEISRELRRSRRHIRLDTGHAAAWNVKLSPGGIRDIEFLVQCLARLYGGREPWLRCPSTLAGLQRLHDKDYLTSRDFFRLSSAYEFLRTVEHRMQLRDGLQRHTLPEAPDALERLARRCGIEATAVRAGREELLRRIEQHFAAVREIYDRILLDQRPRLAAGAGPAAKSIAEPDSARDAHSPDALAQAFPSLTRLRKEHPVLAKALASLLPGADAHARRGWNSFLSAALLRTDVVRQLEKSPEVRVRLNQMFALSDLAAEVLSRAPEQLCVVADPEAHLTAKEGASKDAPLQAAQDPRALRIAYRRRWWAIVMSALCEAMRPSAGSAIPPPFATFEAFTQLGDEALAKALALSNPPAALDDAPFCILAFGRLGTKEMDVGSDADLVFVVDESLAPADREPWRRTTERLLEIVSSHTREGMLFPADTRLRPRGSEGELLQSAAYLRTYYREEAQGWEAAAALKARAVAGNVELGERVLAEIRALLAERYSGDTGAAQLAHELAHTRQRMEREGNPRKDRAGLSPLGGFAPGAEPVDFKSVRGGYYDIDYVIAFLMLTGRTGGTRAGASKDAPLQALARPVALLDQTQLLPGVEPSVWETLRSTAILYRCLDHAARLVTGHPVLSYQRSWKEVLPGGWLWDLPRRHDLHQMLENWGVLTPAGLEASLDTARERVRELYDATVAARAASSPEM